MQKRSFIIGLLLAGLLCASGLRAEDLPVNESSLLLEIRSLTVDGKSLSLDHGQTARLLPDPGAISFKFGAGTNSTRSPMRIRYRLEGFDDTWREDGGEMALHIRYYDASGDRLDQQSFRISGESEGWTGSLETSPFKHRRETVVVPPKATGFWMVMSSAGPPEMLGIYVVNILTISRLGEDGNPTEVLLKMAVDPHQQSDAAPMGWERDGIHPSMAKIVKFGGDHPVWAFAILDDDLKAHAEWHNSRTQMPHVSPGDRLLIEWDEAYSIGLGNPSVANYQKIPPGDYRFRITELTGMGRPTGVEASLRIVVPPPFWKTPWFWSIVVLLVAGATFGVSRYVAWQELQREMEFLKQQQIQERERTRIAQNIHDDLGARVTQISLLSAMAQSQAESPEQTRENFSRISQLSRDLVAALYETVWAVEPENDNLDALGNYLCQMVNQMGAPAQLRCRFNVTELPPDVQISSHTRHNIVMAVKEAVHNVIKHAKASELTVHVSFSQMLLAISIEDNGSGFRPGSQPAGNGLNNIQRRLESIGGSCSIESTPGKGTTVHMRLKHIPQNT